MAEVLNVNGIPTANKRNMEIFLLCIENGAIKIMPYHDFHEVKSVSGSFDDIREGGVYYITDANTDAPCANVWYLEVFSRGGGVLQRATTTSADMYVRVYRYTDAKWCAWKKVATT